MKIDAHQHFWHYDPVRDSWITPAMEVIRRDFLPNDLQPLLARHGIDGCVAVQADQSEDETRFLLDLAEKHPFVQGVVGWVDLRAEDIRERLAYFSDFRLLKGFRHVVQAEPDELFLLRTEFLSGLRALDEFGFTYDLLIYPNHLPVARECVSRLPNQKFVLDHLAKPYIKQGILDKWKHDLQTLARRENVWCKVSGLLTEADWTHWQREDFRPYLDAAFEAFGTDRVLFGSDWPACLVAGEYDQVVEVVEEYLSDFSEEERAKFWGGNATDVYRLTQPTPPEAVPVPA
jgi:L-fuconolactonase